MVLNWRARCGLLLSFALSTACGSNGATTGGDGATGADAGSNEANAAGGYSTTGQEAATRDDASPEASDATLDSGTFFSDAGHAGETGSTTTPEGGNVATDAGADGGTPLDQNGPIAFTTTTATVQNGADSFTENIYLPSSPGAHALVSVTPGLQQPSTAYAPYAERLASYGVVVLMRDDPGLLTQSQVIAADLSYVIGTWLPAQNADASSPLYGQVDMTRVGLSGHSRGGQASLLAAEGALMGHVVAWFGIDPDDPGTIDGFVESTMTAVTTLGSIGIPTAFLGGQVATFCTPANINYQVLYAAAPSPAVEVTAINTSHTEFEVQSACVDCALCVPMGTANPQVVLDFAVRYHTAFFARELLGDASVGPTFQGAGAAADQAAGLVQITSK